MMKKIFLYFIIVTVAFARLNPFDPTEEFEEEKSRLFERFLDSREYDEIEDDFEIEEQKVDDTPKSILKEDIKPDPKKEEKPKPTQESKSQKIEEKKPLSPKIKEKQIEKEAKQEIVPKEAIDKKEEESIKLSKPKEDIKEQQTTLPIQEEKQEAKKENIATISTGLRFVDINYYDYRIEISSKYKVFKKLDLHQENKIVFDFRANAKFTTKRFDIDHPYFKQIAIGNHPKDGFFRVVVELKEPISKYESSYSDTKVVVKHK